MRMRLPSLSTSSCLHRARASSVSPAALIACISGIAGLSALVLVALFGIAILLILVPPVTTAGAGILQIIAATIFVYVASNIPRLLSMRTAGYSDAETAPQRKRVTEPALLGISFVLGTILVSYFGWWHHRLATREYAHSKGCYAQLETADRVPRLETKLALGNPGYQAALYLSNAELHGAMLGMRREVVDEEFSRAATAYFKSYADLPTTAAKTRDGPLLNDLIRCADDDWAPHGQLLNP
jgi:hypothetical protein